jgi:imidazolonepropionase-like amidohydrolase
MPGSYARRAVFHSVSLLAAVALAACGGLPTDIGRAGGAPAAQAPEPYALVPERLFDGFVMREGYGVAVAEGKITAVGPVATLPAVRRFDLPGATLLPGFIDLHAHLAFQHVPPEVVLRHGDTTVRDLGGPAQLPSGGHGSVRRLTAGPIITAPHGYPIPVFGGGGHGHDAGQLAVEVGTPEEARRVVDHLVASGAAVIKIALEPGGSPGAPWSMHPASVPPPWPLPSPEVVKAVVEQAHARSRKVSAHLSGERGAQLALDGGVDEWAHMPCDRLPEAMLARAVAAGVKIVATLDTLSHCPGVFTNTAHFVARGGTLLYGTDMAHSELPWGIDARELELMLHASQGGLSAEAVLSAATARAGEELGLAPLGQLVAGAPADLVAVRGNPLERLKLLEYPGLVVSGGRFVVDDLLHASQGR